MHITLCVDALSPQMSGIGRYTWELCKGLAECDQISTLQFYGRRSLIDEPERLLYEQRRRKFYNHLARVVRGPQIKRALRSSLVHGPNYFLPLGAETGVVTIHDLSVFRFPDTHPTERVAAFERLFASSVSRAAHLITDTETVRQELISSFSVRAEDVTVVPLGVDERFRPMDSSEVAATLKAWNLTPGSYGLSVAAFEPRKRIIELIGAWRRLPPDIRNGYPLVLAGSSGWRNEELHEQISAASAEGWLKHIGYADESALPQLYAGAALFVYPSIYEGFGLPPVEAMASGTPVIAANRSCLPEVCGDAATLVDPDDEEGFTSVIADCIMDRNWRAEAAMRGLERARMYSWRGCVDGTVAVYAKALVTLGHSLPGPA